MFAAATIATSFVAGLGSAAEYFASYSASPASARRLDWDRLVVLEEAEEELAPYPDSCLS